MIQHAAKRASDKLLIVLDQLEELSVLRAPSGSAKSRRLSLRCKQAR